MAKPRLAVIYFNRRFGEMAKELSLRVRTADQVKTTMVWGDKFRSEADVEEDADAVILQRSLANSNFIESIYSQFAANVEIHYVHDNGEFEEESDAGQAEAAAEPDVEAQPEEPVTNATPEEETAAGPGTDEAPAA